MDMQRPDPEDLLKSIAREEAMRKKGKLKIFFGYAAGVGKTYAMLKAARNVKKAGADVVCGYIEPHSRPDTMHLTEGFETVPVKQIDYNGILLQEMDLDAILLRKPELVLVDEFAHTNAQGSRHEKRYQDVEELLNAGINVYTTVNVQHLESLCDIVASITGVLVRERIPDSQFDQADEVQVVDVEPGELMQRLSEGKIYRENQAKRALNHFFTEDNLTALREIALRRTADRVNFITEKTRRLGGSAHSTEEKVAVGISPSPSNQKIIRAAARMAMAFGGSFVGIFVETPDYETMCEEDKKRLKSNMHLAEQFGAVIETICGEDIAFVIAEYAKTSGVSKIVVGRSNTRRSLFGKASLVEHLSFLAPEMEIYIIPDYTVAAKDTRQIVKKAFTAINIGKDLLKSFLILAVSTAIGFVIYDLGLNESNIIMIYILGVLVSGILTESRIVSAGLSVFSIFLFNFFFTAPRYSFEAYNPDYPITFLIMFLVALVTSSLTVKLKRQNKDLAKSAYRTKVLLDTSQLLHKEREIDGIGRTASVQLLKLLSRDIIFYPADNQKLLDPVVYPYENGAEDFRYISESEKAVAAWVFKNNKHAGVNTGTLESAACYYLAIRSGEQVYGVIGIGMKSGEVLAGYENNLIFAILAETAEVMERENLRKQREKATEQANSEKLRANLLRSISHDLRTPLTSISGNADMMLANRLDEQKVRKICTDIYDDSMWLINLVENLLAVTRIEEGSMQIKKQAELLEDIIREALKHVNRKSMEYDINVRMEDEMQLVKADSRLVVQVLINMIDNAVKYTPAGSRIEIWTKKSRNMVRVEISDNGPGIPDQNKEHIFDMFYTANERVADCRRSLGLGLALCKSIVHAHGGEIGVTDARPQGSVFWFSLEAEEVVIHE